MLNRDKLNKLYTLATGKNLTQASVKNSINLNSKQKLDTIQNKRAKYKGLYEDPYNAWVSWYRDIEKDIDTNNSDEAWKIMESNFPGSQEQARDWLRNNIKEETNSKTDKYSQEILLKNKMSKAPSWLAEEMLPDLARLSNDISMQNVSKVKTVYKKDMLDKLLKIQLTELDPEVPVEVHVDDAMKLELLGLLDSATIANGRFVITNENGSIKPAFTLDISQDDTTNIGIGPEADMIREIATPIISNAVDSAINNISDTVAMDNRVASGATIDMLKRGDLDTSEWKNALSILGNKDNVISAGIEGMLTNNPYMDPEDIMNSSLDIGSFEREI